METTTDPAPPAPPPTTTDDGFSDTTPAPEADKPADNKPDDKKAEGDQPPEDKNPKADPADEDEEAKKRHDDEMAKKRIAERDEQNKGKGSEGDPDGDKSPDKPPADDDEPATPEQFLGKLEEDIASELSQIEDENDRRMQTIEARQYLSEAKTATNQLLIDHSRVVADIPLFNSENPDFDKEAYEYFTNQYQAAHTTTDRNGVIWPKQSYYQFMKGASDLLSGATQKGALKGQQAEAKMRGQAEVPSGASGHKKTDEDDPFLKGFGK